MAVLVAVGMAAGGVTATANADSTQRPASPPPETRPATEALVIVVDGSGSMGRRDVAPNRMVAAKRAATAVVRSLPISTRVGLIAYGTRGSNRDEDREESCKDIVTLSAVRTLNERYRASLIDKIDGIAPSGFTPIGRSLERAVLSLPDRRGTVVIVTDGEDTCAPPDACAMARDLKDQYPDITVSTVGLTLGLSEQLACIANATGGLFVTADDTSELERRLSVVTSKPEENVTLLTPSGYGPAQLGDTYNDVADKLDEFPAFQNGQLVRGLWNLRNLMRITYDSAYYYFDADFRLVGVQPFRPVTVDGITLDSRAADVRDVYGDPLQTQGNSALFEASRRTAAGYVMSFGDDPRNGDSRVAAITLCLCVPREAPPESTTTTTLPPLDTVPPLVTIVLTASGYGQAVLGETYDDLADKLDGFPAWSESSEHPGLWDLSGLREIRFNEVSYVFDDRQVLVGVQPDDPLTIDGIDLGASAGEVEDIYGAPIDVRGQQGLYTAAVESAAAYLVTYDGGANRSSSKATGIAVCLCGTEPPPPTEPTEPPPTNPPDTTPPPPPPTEPVSTAPPETIPPETIPPETIPPETIPPETIPPETIPPETIPPETIPPETIPPETVPPETIPPETVPPDTVAPLPAVALHPDGIGDVTFGTPAPDAVAALIAVLGEPFEDFGQPPDPNADCGGPRRITWQFGTFDLVVEITASPVAPADTAPLDSGAVVDPVEPPAADPGTFTGYELTPPRDPNVEPRLALLFDNGLTYGLTWGQWLELLPDSTLETDPDTGVIYGANAGTYFAYFDHSDDSDPLADPTPETLISSIRVGQPACFAA